MNNNKGSNRSKTTPVSRRGSALNEERSALDVYRQWLDEASSSGSSDGEHPRGIQKQRRKPAGASRASSSSSSTTSSTTSGRRAGMDIRRSSSLRRRGPVDSASNRKEPVDTGLNKDPPRPVSPHDQPRMISPRRQLHLLPDRSPSPPLRVNNDNNTPGSSATSKPQQASQQPNGSTPKPLSAPRRIIHQMSFRSMLSPSPQPPPPTTTTTATTTTADANIANSREPRDRKQRPRTNSRQSSLGTLFSDAWIAQPSRARRASSRVSKSGRVVSGHGMYDVPLDSAHSVQRPRSDSSDTVNNEDDEIKKRHAYAANEKRRSVDWEFHPVDGARGWWVVGWAFLACFVSLSTLINYPVYEAYYINTTRGGGDEATLADINRGEDAVRREPVVSLYVVLIGTLMVGFAALGSLGAGIASDILGMRACALAGTLVLCLGLLASAFISRLWALCITQGVLSGVGISLMALPAYTAPVHWFDRRRALATGAAVSGTGLGVLVLTPAYRALLQRQGLAICLFVQAVVTLVLGVAASLGLRPRVDQRSCARMRWRRVILDARVWALMLMALFASSARFAQVLCLPMYARASGSENDTAGVLYTMGAALLVGMVCGGAVADTTGYIAGIGLSELTLGLFTLALYTPSSLRSVAPMYVFAVVFGLTTGTMAAVLPASIAQMFGTQRVATTTGLVLAACAPMLLVMTPAALKFMHLLESGRSIAWLSAISGVFSVVAGAIGMTLPVLQRRYIRRFTKQESDIVW
ncbi:hypothetical protein IWW50_000085 [Coemansia erecta]|nr:hypothetical protein GGF43_000368 [Coemansia sp. RSA 2618]KAJ2830728.1 hypothetical protein IWW50_000085 [Coemansia erecta]